MSNQNTAIKQLLSEYKAKPLAPLELAKIQRLFKQKECSQTSFKTVYQRDPLFCYQLIAEATKATRNRISSPFAADHALSTLGISTASKLFMPLQKSTKELSIEVKLALTTSLLAAQIAKNIGELHGGGKQAYWTSLCYLLPETILWHLLPKAMWAIYHNQLSRSQPTRQFEEQQLGFSLFNWRKAVASEFNLSEQSQSLFDKQLPDKPRELFAYATNGYSENTPSFKEWHRYEGWLIVMANRLARVVLIPWQNNSYQQLINLIHHTGGCDKRKLHFAAQLAIRHVSEILSGSQLPIPAVSYLFNKTKPEFPSWLVKPPQPIKTIAHQVKQKKVISKETQELSLSVSAIKAGLTRLLNQTDKFNSSGEIIQFGLQFLLEELKLDRVSFLTVDYNQSRVGCKLMLAAEGKQKIRPEFSFANNKILAKFTERQTFMHFNQEAQQKIWRQMPASVQMEGLEDFILYSLKPGNKVRGLIYADAKDRHLLTAKRVAVIKKILMAINKSLAIKSGLETSQ